MKIWANTIVNNEENFIWFSIMSVMDFVDKVLVWDTGSTDKTVDIIREIKEICGDKVDFREVGAVDRYEFTKMRQKLLEQSDCDWILILDGDEIWWKDSIKKVVSKIHQGNTEGIAVPMIVPVGDIYHLQQQEAGRYKILGKTGHLSLKAFSKHIPGLHVDFPYGKEGFLDQDNRFLQEREKIIFLNAPFLHVTHLKRSSLKRKYEKFKYEIGKKIEDGFKFPEVFYQKTPSFIPSPWLRMQGLEKAKARLLTPLRKLKRRLI